jgi:hypothetical protein
MFTLLLLIWLAWHCRWIRKTRSNSSLRLWFSRPETWLKYSKRTVLDQFRLSLSLSYIGQCLSKSLGISIFWESTSQAASFC